LRPSSRQPFRIFRHDNPRFPMPSHRQKDLP